MPARLPRIASASLIALAVWVPFDAVAQEQAGVVPAFYTAALPSGLKAGQWISAEPLPPEFGLPAAANQVRFTYGATSGVDEAKVLPTSGVIFLPKGDPPKGGWPIVAWAHGTVGIADRCAPSLNRRSPRDVEYLSEWLGQGLAIVATDYQGLGTPGPHPYLNARAAAYSVLDAIRAARQGMPDLANKVLIVGQSQGAGAALATAGFAPAYAPDIAIVGTVATGLPNLKASENGDGDKVDRTLAYALYIAAMAEEFDPTLKPELGLQEQAMPAYKAAADLCVGPLFQKVEQDKLTRNTTFKPDFLKVYGKQLAAMAYPTLALKQPMFVGTGERDVDTPTQGQLALVHAACDAGSTIESHLYAGLDHSGTVNPSFKDSVLFARKVLAGEAINLRCNPTAQ